MPDEDALAATLAVDNIKVDKLVKDFLTAQTLKVLPRGEFGAAVNEFVDKNDNHSMESFVDLSLAKQVEKLLAIEGDDYDIETAMDEIRAKQEELYAAGGAKIAKKKLAPKPRTWDSDDMGHWADDPASRVFDDDVAEAGSKRGRGIAAIFSDDDDASVVSQPTKKAAAKKAPAKKVPAKPRAPAKAKAPAKAPARGRKKAIEISDEEEDVIMQDDTPPPAKSQPKRGAAAKGQTKLNFGSQAKTQASIELSDDEISDDDAFEPMAKTTRRR